MERKRDTKFRREDKKQHVVEAVWEPKTAIGKAVKEGKITDVDELLVQGKRILDAKVIDVLLPDLENDLLLIGQAKGKFGGGQRRVFRQTQKKTKEGNKPKFSTYAVVGNKNGYIGLGQGSAKETVPAREKAFRNAKQNIMKIRRGCGSWQCGCATPHSIPFAVEGKCGSVKIRLMPAPKGTGLSVSTECAKVLKMAGISDIFSKAHGSKKTTVNLINALSDALKRLNHVKIQPAHVSSLGIIEGKKVEQKNENSSNQD